MAAIRIAIAAAFLCSWSHAQETDIPPLPSFEEMWNFCEMAPKSLEKRRVIPVPQEGFSLTNEKIAQIYCEEKETLQKLAQNFKSRDANKAKSREEKFAYLVALGLFEDALIYLQSGNYLKSTGQQAFEYHLHLAFLYRWLNREEDHNKASQQAKESIAKISSKTNKKRAENLKARYDKKYLQWRRFAPKFWEAHQRVEENPQDLEAWKNIAEYAHGLGYRVEEIVACTVLYQTAHQQEGLKGEEVARLATAYLVADQVERSLTLTKSALDSKITHPEIYAVRIKSYLILGDESNARREFKKLREEFPNAEMSYEKMKEEERNRWQW